MLHVCLDELNRHINDMATVFAQGRSAASIHPWARLVPAAVQEDTKKLLLATKKALSQLQPLRSDSATEALVAALQSRRALKERVDQLQMGLDEALDVVHRGEKRGFPTRETVPSVHFAAMLALRLQLVMDKTDMEDDDDVGQSMLDSPVGRGQRCLTVGGKPTFVFELCYAPHQGPIDVTLQYCRVAAKEEEYYECAGEREMLLDRCRAQDVDAVVAWFKRTFAFNSWAAMYNVDVREALWAIEQDLVGADIQGALGLAKPTLNGVQLTYYVPIGGGHEVARHLTVRIELLDVTALHQLALPNGGLTDPCPLRYVGWLSHPLAMSPAVLYSMLGAAQVKMEPLDAEDQALLPTIVELLSDFCGAGLDVDSEEVCMDVSVGDALHRYRYDLADGMHVLAVQRIPLPSIHALPDVVAGLRQQHVFHDLLGSCIVASKPAQMTAKATTTFSLVVAAPAHIALHFFAKNLIAVEIDVDLGGTITCTVFGVPNVPQTSAYLAAMLTASHSIPHAIERIIKTL